MDHARYISIEVLQNLIHLFQSLLYLEVNLKVYTYYTQYCGCGPYLERVVLPLIIRPKGGGYYTRAALIRVRNLLPTV